MNPARFSTLDADFEARFAALLGAEATEDRALAARVRAIIADVRARGDEALLDYTRQFDQLDVADATALELSADDLAAALEGLPDAIRQALNTAAERIRAFHSHQLAHSWQYAEPDGMVLGQRISALARVGLYVPGGRAAYPSSVLMNALPAKVAGVRELIMVVPTPRGERSQAVLAAAALAGVSRVFAIGGAQAIAALAFGTASIPRVDKIVGPGNAYVAEAKRQVFGAVGIDMVAGPSEVLVIADASAHPDWVVMDLFAQAEHDVMARSVLLCPDAGLLDAVEAAIGRLLPQAARADIIGQALATRGALIQVRDLTEACTLADRIAPEHLSLSVADPERWLASIHHAGAIFLGHYASESIGDYCAGPNHVLPTAGSARFASPLGVYDFQKRTSLITVSPAAARRLGPVAANLARSEGLAAHAEAASLRMWD
ncbi:MAG: histidinol dehydrogenase [Betaproteobacteria bacterium]